MRRAHVRFVVSVATVAAALASSAVESAPPPSPPKPPQRSQQSAIQNNGQRSRTANGAAAPRRGVRTAQANGKSKAAKPAAAVPFEKADPQTRADFQKLIGANWIWSPAYAKDEVPAGNCYFRKTIMVGGKVDFAQAHVACDNTYELYVNDQPVGNGSDWRKMDVHDITKLVKPGVNVIGIKASNTDAGAAGLVARIIVKEGGGTFESFSSDASWKTSVKEFEKWKETGFRDREWIAAKVYGPLGGVLPWGDEVVISNEGSRFLVDPEFAVERLVTDDQAGSLINMAFNAQGNILVSQEGGPLLLVSDADRNGSFEKVQTFCEELKNVQGIVSLGAIVLAVGEGPDGGALYRMTDNNSDGKAEDLKTLVKFRGQIGEHGPHAVQLGPEGLIYVLCGNFARVDIEPAPKSPYAISYEGDLVRPKYDDPQGFAAGVPAPGGTIIRTDTDGSFVETFAGGMRNPYDFAFNGDGELFTYDADMEWDIGTPWYRPTRVNHVPPGAELGWRSGWAKWPEYYLDSLPATLDVGAGSPTGVTFYDHFAMPRRLQNSLFVGDWALGEIHAVQFERKGASYAAKISTVLKGRPLNVTDLAVGPDGALYFCTGGRGTDGGVYRLRWKGTPPKEATDMGKGIQQALRQPQFQSDWARRRIAVVQKQLGDRWGSELEKALSDSRTKPAEKLRALDLMTFFGPAPTFEQLIELARDRDPVMRAKVARLMGTQQDPVFNDPLVGLLGDSEPWIRRLACEAIAHRQSGAPTDELVALLGDSDRFVAFAARRTLEGISVDKWQQQILSSKKTRVFLNGSAGLLAAAPSSDLAMLVLDHCEALLRGEKRDPKQPAAQFTESDLRDTLRVIELALERGAVPADGAPGIARQIVLKYPTTDAMANREMVRLLVYLAPPEAARALAKQLASDSPDLEKLHIAAYAARLTSGWSIDEKLAMLRYYESIRGTEGGHSVDGYIENFARDFFTNLTLEERRQVLAAGESFPTSALSILAKLPEDSGADIWAELRALDGRLEGKEGEAFTRLRVGIVATLGASKDSASLAYLRDVYEKQPERRSPVAMSLTQQPEGENWEILVDSLRSIDGIAAPEVLSALTKVKRRPEKADAYRDVILQGLRTPTNAGPAVQLLSHWTGMKPRAESGSAKEPLVVWQAWYAKQFPDALPAELPHDAGQNKWSYDELLSYLESSHGKVGNATRGAKAYRDAQCARCHRFQGSGEGVGPDLTTVGQRFQRKEILEAIVYPSHVVSDQYASKMVIAAGRTYVGITSREPDGGVMIVQSDGQKVHIAAADVEEIEPSKQSVMPDGLLNTLSLEQVADMFAYLTGSPTGMAQRLPAGAGSAAK